MKNRLLSGAGLILNAGGGLGASIALYTELWIWFLVFSLLGITGIVLHIKFDPERGLRKQQSKIAGSS